MKTKVFLIVLFLSQIALSQTVVKSSIDNGGASISNANIELLYTIGEVNVQEVTVSNISISEGFINPILINTPPIIDNIIAPVDPIALRNVATVTAEFTDDNLREGLIDWGDGSGLVPGTISGNTVTWSYTYPFSGVYPITVRLIDEGNESVEEIYRYIVIYDPSGGFVTGGGWINSPAGAFIADPLLEGKANFGFVAKYKKGQTVPTGNTEFQFKAGDLKFNSSLFDWLVVAGSKAQFKGEGTINSMGSYGFMISAIDEDSTDKIDKFRIKIWDMANEAVVYDNQNGTEDNSDPASEIQGGAIVVHAGKGNNAKISDSKEPMEEEAISGLNVVYWPNPTNDYFNLELKTNNRVDKVNIYVFDLNRRLVHVDKFDVNQQYQFGDRLQSGIYFVKLSQANNTKTIRVVKY